MRTMIGAFVAVALLVGAVTFVSGPGRATAQGGATIEAVVTYAGAADVETIRVNKDTQVCGTEAKNPKILVGPTKGLAHAVVSVAGLKGAPTAKAAEKPALDQRGCAFRPRVVAMVPGELDFLNNDGILHNIHTYSTANAPINKAQPRFRKVLTEKFQKPEIIKVTCDVHSWMLGWIAVLPHPYFGVTGEEGAVKIENVPAGKHTLEVWHETLGKQTTEVEVKAGQVAKVSIAMVKK